MDERTPEYPWLPVEPASAVEPTWTTVEAAEEPAPAQPVWTPAVWAPATAAVEAQAEAEPEPAPAVEPAPAKTPLLKRELSFRRTPKAEPAEGAQAKPSLLGKELSFRRKPKAPKAEQAAPKTSLLKRELSFKRKPKAAKAERVGPRKPLLKRELSFRRKPKPAKLRTPKTKPATAAPKKLVGLKIGASQLAAARVDNGSSQLLQLARATLEPGIVVGGEVRDPDGLADALRTFFAKNKLPKRGVRLGIASNRIGVRVFELAGIDDPRQLENAIRFRAQEALPIPIDEAVLDYQLLDERVDADGRTVRRVLLVVAYRELIDRYVAACRKAGVQLVGIDLEAFALLRALSGPGSDLAAEPAALVAVSIGSDRSTFAVSDGTTCEFTRVLEWGGISLDVALARALDLSPSEAEPIKRAVGLEGDAPEDVTAEQLQTAREAIRAEVQTFARELVSSLQFYQNQPGSLGIAEIVVTGGTAHLAGLADQLEKLIGVRVRLGDPLEHVRPSKRLREVPQIGSLTVAIGLGVER